MMDKEIWALGNIVERRDIKSSMGAFQTLPEYKTIYPQAITRALGELCDEYSSMFVPLVEANREWDSDYRYCMLCATPISFAVQIDMVGLPQTFLDATASMPVAAIREILRDKIFEIENSLAWYQFLEKIFSKGQENSFFKNRYRAYLANLREMFGMPIALLAVTDQKHRAIRELEFGKGNGEPMSDAEVFDLSGFDRLFGPTEFRQHVEENRSECQYLLYARTSDPIAKLKNPALVVENSLLSDHGMRRIIKAHALTLNIDAPEMQYAKRINDTKEYMPMMGMAFPVHSEENLFSSEFVAHLLAKKPYADFNGAGRLASKFARYLQSREIDPRKVESGEISLRAKPLKGTYGCYGHITGKMPNTEFRKELRKELRKRGAYVLQPEMETPVIVNETDGRAYTYIDRNFFSSANGRQSEFLGGFRTLMPLDSIEAKEGRIHGNGSTVYAEITA